MWNVPWWRHLLFRDVLPPLIQRLEVCDLACRNRSLGADLEGCAYLEVLNSGTSLLSIWSGLCVRASTALHHLYRCCRSSTVWYLSNRAHWHPSKTVALNRPFFPWNVGFWEKYLGVVDGWGPGLPCLVFSIWWSRSPHVTQESCMDSPLEIAAFCFNGFGFQPILVHFQIWLVFLRLDRLHSWLPFNYWIAVFSAASD